MSSQLSVVRSASLNGYLELARALGIDAQAMLRRVGLNARLLADPEAPISTHAVSDLLQLSAEFSGTDDFGLQLAARPDRAREAAGPPPPSDHRAAPCAMCRRGDRHFPHGRG